MSDLFELKHNPNIIEIPDNAANGDMIKALFPNLIICKGYENIHAVVIIIGDTMMSFREDWWNAPYKLSELEGENKQTDVSIDPYEMKYIRCGKGENNERN